MNKHALEIEIYNSFYAMFGLTGVEKVMAGFNIPYRDFEQVRSSKHRGIMVRRMKAALEGGNDLANHRKVMSDENRLERVWTTADGREKPISRMGDGHLHNTILLIDRKMKLGEWRIGANEDLPELITEMEEERVRRGLHLPLIPYKSLSYRKRENHDY